MTRWHWALVSAASGAAMLGLATTSSMVVLANHLIDDLTQPNGSLDDAAVIWGSWLVPNPQPDPPETLCRPVMFRAPHGPLLRGDFWAQPQPAPTVVICHGYRVSRAKLRNVAALEYATGMNVLIFDFRGHGESEAVATSGGNAEVRDLEAAIDLAAAQPETMPGKIFLHGFSMGAAIALLMAPRPEVAGIIADSPYARLDEMLHRLVHWRLTTESEHWIGPMRWLRGGLPAMAHALVTASALVFRCRFHYALLARPEATLRRWQARVQRRQTSPTPILLIHALRDRLIPIDHARRLIAAAQESHVPIEIFFADTDIHCGAYGCDPARYVEVIQRFVARYR